MATSDVDWNTDSPGKIKTLKMHAKKIHGTKIWIKRSILTFWSLLGYDT